MMPNHDHPFPPLSADVRLLMEPTGCREGILDGAWWPRSRDLRRELPGLINALQESVGPILRARVDPGAWDDRPSSLVIDGRFLRIGESPSPEGTIRVIRGDQDAFLLLVIPPDTAPRVAVAAMSAVAGPTSDMRAQEFPRREAVRHVRAYDDADQEDVLALINADRLPGQAPCTAKMLGDAVEGVCASDPIRWAELERPRTEVMTDDDGEVVGVISSTTRVRDDAGLILWLHGRELVTVIEPLVGHVLGWLGPRPAVQAFSIPSALTPGLGALPSRRRPVTCKVLEHAGFAGRGSWHYLHRDRGGLILVPTSPLVRVEPSLTPPGWWLTIREQDLAVEAVVETPVDGVGVLWWLGTDLAHADATLDQALLDQAMAVLYTHGAHEVLLYAEGEPCRPHPGWSLFDSAGFTEVDHLMAYERS
ncbi:DUF5994 family protein [Nonomuraea sediminis]|uniref:DUF5994 family protein n=1 Tax=Nonomuraea sediminis TaxID=2835864 RepID=UPI001BDC6146|nr:DUF5994 family protein [Nonomuraea sediminis]